MAKQTNLYLTKGVNNSSFVGNLTAAGLKPTIFTAGADDSDVKAIVVASEDNVLAISMMLYVSRAGTDYLLGTVNIPITAGFVITFPAVDLINSYAIAGLPVDKVGKRFIPLKTGDLLKIGVAANMTAGKNCHVNVFGYDY